MLIGLCFQWGCPVGSEDVTQRTPLKFRNLLRKQPAVYKLPLEFGFTPPVPLSDDRVAMFAYRTPGLPGRGFTLDAPEYRIVAAYPGGHVHEFNAVTPQQLGLSGSELGPLRGIEMPFEEHEALERDFDQLYGILMQSYSARVPAPLSQAQCQRFKEVFTIVVDPRLWPVLRHANAEFMHLIQSCLDRE
jgi:hypothetical protein